MMVLTQSELRTLLEQPTGPYVSIFLPTHRAGADSQQDPIRLKNLLRQAEERLLALGKRRPEARKLLAPARALLKNPLFWRHLSDGLAIFLSPDLFRAYRLPLAFAELVVVADRFHVKPLLPLLIGDGRFYLLALSQNEVRLFLGSRDGIGEVELAGVPPSLDEALQYDNLQQKLQFHADHAGGIGPRTAVWHGHGEEQDNAKDHLLLYFRQVDAGLRRLLHDERVPLVLAGVEYLLPIYKEANSYPHLLDQGIEGNPEHLAVETLHERAWAIVQPAYQKAAEMAAARYRQLAGTGQTANDLREILSAAWQGRVESLFVAVGLQLWGHFDPGTGALHVHADAEAGDEDLTDVAAVQTLLHGGAVYAVAPENVPGEAPLAAVFRY